MTQIKNHLVATACILTWLFSQASHAGESTIGNGGDALVCPSGVTMLDAYEAAKNGYPLDLGNSALTLEEKIDIVLRRIDNSLSPTDDIRKSIAESFNELLADYRLYLQNPGQPVRGTVVNFTNEDLMDIPDAGRGGYPANCTIKQIAIQKKPVRFTDLKYDIDIKLLAQLDTDNLVMLFTHETFWGLRSDHISSSETIRYAVGQLSSNLLDNPSVLDKGSLAYSLDMDWKHNSLAFTQPKSINKKSFILNPLINSSRQNVLIQGASYELKFFIFNDLFEGDGIYHFADDNFSTFDGRSVSLFETGAPARYTLKGQYHLRIANQNYDGIVDCEKASCDQSFSIYFDEQGKIINLEEFVSKSSWNHNLFRNVLINTYSGTFKKLFYTTGALAISTSASVRGINENKSLTVLDPSGSPVPAIEDIETSVNTNAIGYYSSPKYRNIPLVFNFNFSHKTRSSLHALCKQLGSTSQKFLMAYHADTEPIKIQVGTTYAYYSEPDRAFKIETADKKFDASKINNFICLGSDFKLLAPAP